MVHHDFFALLARMASRFHSLDHLKKLHLYRWSTSSLSRSLRPLSYPGPTGLEY